jgi:hypothetical protein
MRTVDQKIQPCLVCIDAVELFLSKRTCTYGSVGLGTEMNDQNLQSCKNKMGKVDCTLLVRSILTSMPGNGMRFLKSQCTHSRISGDHV